jgi:hypothetical protein
MTKNSRSSRAALSKAARRPAVARGRRHPTPASASPSSRPGSASRRGIRPQAPRHHEPIDPEIVYVDLLDDLTERSNRFAWACCPFHDDRHPSFCVNLDSGWFKCHSSSCGETGSNIVSFVGRLLGMEYAEARRHLETQYG